MNIKLNSKIISSNTRPISKVVYNPDGDILFIASKDGTITGYRTEDFSLFGRYAEPNVSSMPACRDLNLDSKGKMMITGSSELFSWDVETGKLLKKECKNRTYVTACSFSDDDNIYSCSVKVSSGSGSFTPSSLHVYDKRSGSEILKLDSEKDSSIEGGCWSIGNKYLYIGNDKGIVQMYDLAAGKYLKNAPIHKDSISQMTMSSTKTEIVTGSDDHSVCVIDPANLSLLRRIEHMNPINTVAYSPQYEEIFFSGSISAENVTTSHSGGFCVYIHSLLTGMTYGKITPSNVSPIETIAIHPYGESVAMGTVEGNVTVSALEPAYHKYAHGIAYKPNKE